MRPIFVRVSRLWRALGALFTLASVAAVFAAIHALMTTSDAETQINCITHLVLMPVIFPLLLPCFIQKYPPWVIRIYGYRFLRWLPEALR